MLGDMVSYWFPLDGAYDGLTQMWKNNYGFFVLWWGGRYTTQHVKSYSPTRIEPVPPTLKGQSLNHWASREVLELWVLYLLLESFC